eukprot:12431157-Prorocentrum_lima.AAC.1
MANFWRYPRPPPRAAGSTGDRFSAASATLLAFAITFHVTRTRTRMRMRTRMRTRTGAGAGGRARTGARAA